LHLDGILFPHINDDARSKSHQTQKIYFAFIINKIKALYCENISEHESHKLLCRKILSFLVGGL